MVIKTDEPWIYDQISIGLNYRMSDLNAALGLSQILKIDKFITKRHEIARNYSKQLSYRSTTSKAGRL